MMDSITNFLGMGGYAAYVWPAYALVFAGLVALLVCSRRTLTQNRKQVEALEANSPRRRNRANPEKADAK